MSWRDKAGSLFTTYKGEVVASRGIVAANHPMASAAGIEMLAMGGNAIDAAIAALFALTVVEPMMVGIFGAGYVNFYHAASGKIINIDNYAVAPSAAASDMYQTLSDSWPDYLETVDGKNRVGYLAVGVPGTLKCWCHLEEAYGKLGLETVVQPAIRYAAAGFSASHYLVDIINSCRDTLSRFPASRSTFLHGGAPPNPGDLIVQGDYERTLRLIAREGSDVLYDGEIGERVARDMAAGGGIITSDDLRDYRFIEREAVRGTYRGYEIVGLPPPTAGGVHIIQMLNMLEGYDIASLGFGSSASIHLLAEVLKIAFADRFRYMGDPDFVDVPVGELISKEYAELRRREIDPERAGDYLPGDLVLPERESKDTTHITVADDDGNVVAMTQTIHEVFGSKVMIPGTGMLLNNTMYIFDPHPGKANSIAPGKRMLSSMSPTIIMKDGRPFMALGTPGGVRIFASVLQALVNVIDHGMTLQEAVEAPRVWTQGVGAKHSSPLLVEEGIGPKVREELVAKGHNLEVVAKVAGGMNGVMFDHQAGQIHGAACWRADGAPAGISGGPAKPGLLDSVYNV